MMRQLEYRARFLNLEARPSRATMAPVSTGRMHARYQSRTIIPVNATLRRLLALDQTDDRIR